MGVNTPISKPEVEEPVAVPETPVEVPETDEDETKEDSAASSS